MTAEETEMLNEVQTCMYLNVWFEDGEIKRDAQGFANDLRRRGYKIVKNNA